MNAGRIVFFGGPAGAGKSTLARRWCAEQERAAQIQLDEIRHLIVSGLADPQQPDDPSQPEQYALAVAGCAALARVFAEGGLAVAVDDVLEPDAFEREWKPRLDGLDWSIVIVLPSLEETLMRSSQRHKGGRSFSVGDRHTDRATV